MTTTTIEEGSAIFTTSTSMDALAAMPKWPMVKETIKLEALASGVACSKKQVNGLIAMLFRALAESRTRGPYHLTEHELKRFHGVLEVIMPGNATNPAPGSAHELLNLRLLRDSEISIVHTSDERYGNTFCAVEIYIDAT